VLDDLQEVPLVLRAAADVVDLSARMLGLVDHGRVERAQVARIEEVAHLQAVAVDRERPVVEDRMYEVRYPSLVFRPVLMRAVDAALAQDDRVHVKAARVVPDVLIGGSFAASVRAVEVDRLALFTGNVVLVELSVHLIRRCENKRRLGVVQAGGLQEIESAARVDVEVSDGIDQRGGHRDLPREVEDRVLVLHLVDQSAGIPHVLFDEGRARGMARDQPLEVSLGAWPAEVVEHGHVPPVVDQADRRVDAEKARAAGDEDTPAGIGPGRARFSASGRFGFVDQRRGIHWGSLR